MYKYCSFPERHHSTNDHRYTSIPSGPGPASESRVSRSRAVGAAPGRATELTEVSELGRQGCTGERFPHQGHRAEASPPHGHRGVRRASGHQRTASFSAPEHSEIRGADSGGKTNFSPDHWDGCVVDLEASLCCTRGKRNLRNGQVTEKTDVDKEQNPCSPGGGVASPSAL